MGFLKLSMGTNRVTLKSAQFRQQQGNYGPQYMYELANGDTLAASSYLHDMIQAVNGLGAGTVLDITKSKQGQKVRWGVDVVQEGSPEDPFVRQGQAYALDYETARGKPLFSDLVAEYQACLVAAREVCGEEFAEFGNEDVRTIATTLWIHATREGVTIPKA